MRVAVGPFEELPTGALKRITVEGLPPLVIGNADGTVFCLKDECNHGEANLSEGELCGFELLCPLHSGSFDVRSGKAVKRPAKLRRSASTSRSTTASSMCAPARTPTPVVSSRRQAASRPDAPNCNDIRSVPTRREDQR